MALTSGTAIVTSVSGSSIVASCGAASGGSGTYTYQWFRSSDVGNTWSSVAGATALTITDNTVVQGTLYVYQLRSTDTVGGKIVYSNKLILLAEPLNAGINQDSLGATGIPAQVSLFPSPNKRIIDATDPNNVYTCIALQGTSPASKSWFLELTNTSGSITTVTHAIDSYNNRATASYS